MKTFLLIIGILATSIIRSQERGKMDFDEYNPPSTLVVPGKPVTKAKFPFIDVHNHQFSMPTMDLSTLTKEMDRLNMRVMVNLSGQSGEVLRQSVGNVQKNYPSRFIVFANADFKNI